MGLPVRVVLVMSVLTAVFFLPAGSFNWPEAWLVISVYLALSLAAFGWMKKHDPDLLAERTSRGALVDGSGTKCAWGMPDCRGPLRRG